MKPHKFSVIQETGFKTMALIDRLCKQAVVVKKSPKRKAKLVKIKMTKKAQRMMTGKKA